MIPPQSRVQVALPSSVAPIAPVPLGLWPRTSGRVGPSGRSPSEPSGPPLLFLAAAKTETVAEQHRARGEKLSSRQETRLYPACHKSSRAETRSSFIFYLLSRKKMMSVKLMTGPRVPHEEDAKVQFAAWKGGFGCFVGSSRIDGEGCGLRYGGLAPAHSPSPTPGLPRALGDSAGCQWGGRGLSLPAGHGNVPLAHGSQLGAASGAAGRGTRRHRVRQERARPLSAPCPVSAFHTTKQHPPLCPPALRFTALPRARQSPKPPGSPADPGWLQKLPPAPG